MVNRSQGVEIQRHFTENHMKFQQICIFPFHKESKHIPYEAQRLTLAVLLTSFVCF